MIEWIAHLLLTAVLLLVVAKAVDGVEVDGFGAALFGAFLLGLANAFVRPLLLLLALPITVVTLGLFVLVVNALVLGLVAGLVRGIRVKGLGPAFFGALLLSVLNLIISIVLGPGEAS